ncbi:MAG: hypothetical protein NC307_07095 [Roseburia sp.]|nr:hypothetical protein [Roseburia sp.]
MEKRTTKKHSYKNLKDISLLIIGFDPYIDVWDHYFELLDKYWAKRPKTYLATNTIEPDYLNVTVFPIGKDAEWSKKVYKSLEKLDTKYVLLLLEDFFTTSYVNNKSLDDLIGLMKENNISYCKLLNQSKMRGMAFKGKKYLHVIKRDDEYGISLQPAIWEKEFLKELVGTGNYNAWVFEMNQIRNKYQNNNGINCLADDRNILQITHAVVQSQYLRHAVRVFKKQGYYLNVGKRKVMSVPDTIKYRAKQFFSEYTPRCLKPFMKNMGRLFKFSFVSDRR